MTNMLSVQYESKGEKEFVFPFEVSKETEIVVWVNNILQTKSDYYIDFNGTNIIDLNLIKQNKSGKVIFFEKVGDESNSKIVTIEKDSIIERKSDFSDFSTFRAESLNLELDNFIDILNSMQLKITNGVQKSKLEDTETILIFPKVMEGKGIYWGKNGELLNTDQNINDLLNHLAQLNPNTPNAKIDATKISINTSSTTIKQNNAQEFLQVLDKNTTKLVIDHTSLANIVSTNNNNLNTITSKVNDTIIPELQSASASIQVAKSDIVELQEAIKNVPNSSGKLYSVISYPRDENGRPNYLRKLKPYHLELVNISNNTPLTLSFAYNGSPLLFKADNINKFTKLFCNMPNTGAGRYYIRAELRADNKINLIAHKSRPYFGLNKPIDKILTASGCVPNDSDYFVINDLSFYGGSGQFKNKPAKYMYLGYVDLNADGEVVSEVTYFTHSNSFETFLDVVANQSYIVPNLLMCNCVDVQVYAFFQDALLPVYNQGNLSKNEANVLETGTNFTYNLDQITINTAKKGVFSYYKGGELISDSKATLKIIVTRNF